MEVGTMTSLEGINEKRPVVLVDPIDVLTVHKQIHLYPTWMKQSLGELKRQAPPASELRFVE